MKKELFIIPIVSAVIIVAILGMYYYVTVPGDRIHITAGQER